MLYIHIPYCKGKCIYCDFYSGGNPDWKKYLKAVASELSVRADLLRGDCLSSIYIGGGTPSLIPPDEFTVFMADILSILRERKIEPAPDIETTIEVNPEDVDIPHVSTWKAGGINRVSMGVQSLEDKELKFLKRRHNAERALRALELLRGAFNNVSIDLIYGIPGQTEESLNFTLDRIIAQGPQHVSAYALTYEHATPLGVWRDRGQVTETPEETYLKFDDIISGRLEEAGYERYEISNYALPGYHSRHNSGYWNGNPYLGLGPSASSFDGDRRRRTNRADLHRYLEGTFNYDEEILSREERLEEIVMVSLRRRHGIDMSQLTLSERGSVLAKAQRWVESGHLVFEENHLALTKKGIRISDFIILSLI